jgi:hypothetical protein
MTRGNLRRGPDYGTMPCCLCGREVPTLGQTPAWIMCQQCPEEFTPYYYGGDPFKAKEAYDKAKQARIVAAHKRLLVTIQKGAT